MIEKIAIIGLGYVGLPLAVEFGKKRPVVGFDISRERINELRSGVDRTMEVGREELAASHHLELSAVESDLRHCKIFIVAVPTPVDSARRPDLTLLQKASELVARHMPNDALVIFESTVYPGCTRDVCVPALERVSGKTFNRQFFVGYSPERVNPGDKSHRLHAITKVTSGSTPEIAKKVDDLYKEIIAAGTFSASSIEVAEAAKVIENTQRDLNIALMNELAIIFHRLNLDTNEVLAAAGTKWNFLPFKPGLVGGHCIGVDPYYLTHRAQELGYHPEVILAGRRINDGMGLYIADRVARLMMKRGFGVVGGRLLVLGLTFKENCPDLRNSKVIDVVNALREFNATVDVWDPLADATEARHEYGVELLAEVPRPRTYDAVIVAVSHQTFVTLGADAIRRFGKPGAVLFDVKGVFEKSKSDGRL